MKTALQLSDEAYFAERGVYFRQQSLAWDAVAGANRRGTIVKQPCAKCGAAKADGHHEDYDRPLDLTWLCPSHHRKRHAAMHRGISLEDWLTGKEAA